MSNARFRTLIYSLRGLSDQLSLLAEWIEENCVGEDYIRNAPTVSVTLFFSKMKGIFSAMHDVQQETRSIKLRYEECQREKKAEAIRCTDDIFATKAKIKSHIVSAHAGPGNVTEVLSSDTSDQEIATIVAMVIQQLRK